MIRPCTIIVGVCVAIAVLILILVMTIESGTSELFKITNQDFKAVVFDTPGYGGKSRITETLTFESTTGEEVWELWTGLPEIDFDGLDVRYQIESVKVYTNGASSPITFTEARRLYEYDSDYVSTSPGLGPNKWYHARGEDLWEDEDPYLILYIYGFVRATFVVEITYLMDNSHVRYGDSSELYYIMNGGYDIKELKHFSGQIIFDNSMFPGPENYFAWSYGTRAYEFPFEISDTMSPGSTIIHWDLGKDDLPFTNYNMFLEFDLVAFGDDKHKFTQHVSNTTVNHYRDGLMLDTNIKAHNEYLQEYEDSKSAQTTVMVVMIILAIVIIIAVIVVDIFVSMKNNFHYPPSRSSYDIPSNLDPVFAAALVFSKSQLSEAPPEGFAAAIVGLVSKNYIRLEKINQNGDWSNQNMRLFVNPRFLTHQQQPPMPPGTAMDPSMGMNMGMEMAVPQPVEPSPQYYDQANPMAGAIPRPAQQADYGQPPLQDPNNPYNANIQVPLGPNEIEMQSFDAPLPAPGMQFAPADIPLSPSEELHFNLFLRYAINGPITMQQFEYNLEEDYDYVDTFLYNKSNLVRQTGMDLGYFKEGDYTKPKFTARVVAIILFCLGGVSFLINLFTFKTRLYIAHGAFFYLGGGLIIAGILELLLSMKYVLLTESGEDAYQRWRAFYNYLKRDQLTVESMSGQPGTWTDIIVYATAFGLSDHLSKIMNINVPTGVVRPVYNDYFRTPYFHTGTRRMYRNTRRHYGHYGGRHFGGG